ncbi:hypothetical protein ABWH96_19285 [Marivirga tractuosa]|uniref:hypothetical protein n=1 Tax=Marivirga tractuosa TaxID=1006 RepID=UPI0035D0DE5B
MGKQEKIVVYSSNGKPLSQFQYKKEIDEAIEQIESGQFVSQKEMNKKIKKSI